MNSNALTNQAPVFAFHWCAVMQAGIPGQRHAQRTSVTQVDSERIIAHFDLLDADILQINYHGVHASLAIDLLLGPQTFAKSG